MHKCFAFHPAANWLPCELSRPLSETTEGKQMPLKHPTQFQRPRNVPKSFRNFPKLVLPCKIIHVYSNDSKEGKAHVVSLRG